MDTVIVVKCAGVGGDEAIQFAHCKQIVFRIWKAFYPDGDGTG